MYIVIDVMEHNIYHYQDEIEMGFKLDMITAFRDRFNIPYKITYYNNGKIISIREI
jgi:hypothetical protein